MLLADALTLASLTPVRRWAGVWAEDVAQAAQLEVWRWWTPDATPQQIRGWARRGGIDELRRVTGRRRHPHLGYRASIDAVVGDHADGVAEAVDAARVLRREPAVVRRMIAARMRGDTLAVIGAAEGVTESRVSQVLTAAIRRMEW